MKNPSLKDLYRIQNFSFSNMIDTKERKRITNFIESKLFPIDFFTNPFEMETEIYFKDLENEFNIIESLIHNQGKAARFNSSDLNDALLDSCLKSNLNDGTYWFNVNVHDNNSPW